IQCSPFTNHSLATSIATSTRDDVWMFWNNVKLEADTMKLKCIQFAVDQSLMGNKANSILNKMKINFILNQKNNASIIGSKWTYPNEESTPSTLSTLPNKVEYNLHFAYQIIHFPILLSFEILLLSMQDHWEANFAQ
ncbi:5516_t:CDS:2, partial [Dentiscutata erythropus]